MTDLDYTDYVTIKVIKVHAETGPAFWQVEVTDKDGNNIGSATGPRFYGVTDYALEIVMRDGWQMFDANERHEK
jgi:hypothetical protein